MKAAVFQKPGVPQRIETVPDPIPGMGQAMVKVSRCGICGTDLHMTDPQMGTNYMGAQLSQFLGPGTILGHEFSGEVIDVGPGVDKLRIGDRLTSLAMSGCGTCISCLEGRPIWCAAVRPVMGGYGEYTLVPQNTCLLLPSTLSLADGAIIEPLACGLHAVDIANLRPGSRVLVIGAGPIGLATIFWARRLGSGRIAATAKSRLRAELALQMGADAFIDPGADDLSEAATQALGGAPDIVFECVGLPGLVQKAILAVRPRGKIVVVGICVPTDSVEQAAALIKEISVQYVNAYALSDFQTVADTLDKGDLTPVSMVTDTVSLDSFPSAFEALRVRSHQCKVMVDPWL